MSASVILLGAPPFEGRILPGIAGEFGWAFNRARHVEDLQMIGEQCSIVAVLFQADRLQAVSAGMIEAIRLAAPGARPIICQRFSDSTSWPAMAAAGAFHSLRVPFAVPEVRQSFGFVWAGMGIPKPVYVMKTWKAVA